MAGVLLMSRHVGVTALLYVRGAVIIDKTLGSLFTEES